MEEAELFIDALLNHLRLPQGSRVLDLACGKGRHAHHLAENGLNVTGIDLSEESIEAAKELESERLEFFVNDMRKLFWSDHFDAIFNLFTSFGYFHSEKDDQKTMNSVADALKPDGQFVMDFMNVNKVISNLVPEEEKVIDGIHFGIRRSVENGMIVKRITVTDGEDVQHFREEVDALRKDDLERYMKNAGLQVTEVFGNYQLRPFESGTSDRLIIIAQKN